MNESFPPGEHPLDHPVRASLLGAHASFAERRGDVLSYPADMSPFMAVPENPSPQDWADAAALAGPGGLVVTPANYAPFPSGWETLRRGEGVQMVAESLQPADEPEAVVLGPSDVPDMLDLTARTRPGPFGPRTIEFGTYLGIRRDGKLVAMAGERLRPPGYTEVSAVCTDDGWRGHGFASRLSRAVAASIMARGETPFLHAIATNTSAIRLYEALGFTVRRTTVFPRARVPGGGEGAEG